MTPEVHIKQGASLLLSLAFSDRGQPMDLTSATLTSEVRDARNDLVAMLPIVIPQPTTGVAGITVLDTSLWPRGTLRCDVRLVIGGQTSFSETFAIHLEQAVTR